MKLSTKELCLQAFLSQAIADAFCYPYEFTMGSPKNEILDDILHGEDALEITDDTQMAMFGLYGLGAARRSDTGLNLHQDLTPLINGFILPSYMAWFTTQGVPTRYAPKDNWLVQRQEMHKVQGPGNTCLGSLHHWIRYGAQPKNNSMGDGAVMRSLPFLFAPYILNCVIDPVVLAVQSGALTHGHEESERAVRMFMSLAMGIYGEDRSTALDTVSTLIDLWDAVPKGMKSMKQLEDAGHDTFTALPATIAAVLTLRNALKKNDYNIILCECSDNPGDSDTVAAIAGSLWGLVQAPPADLVKKLVEKEVIEELVNWTFGS